MNKTDEIAAKSQADQLRLGSTVGMRAAGTFGNVVLFGGPGLGGTLNLFAFDATTKAYLGSKSFTEYGNIRTFLVADGALYLGVGVGRNGVLGGGVLRWTGNTASPFDFVNVATLPVQAADLTVYNGRIAATSWPNAEATSAAGPRRPLDQSAARRRRTRSQSRRRQRLEVRSGTSASTSRTRSSPRPTAAGASRRSAATSTGAPCTCR